MPLEKTLKLVFKVILFCVLCIKLKTFCNSKLNTTKKKEKHKVDHCKSCILKGIML